jgi:hypothetical protein
MTTTTTATTTTLAYGFIFVCFVFVSQMYNLGKYYCVSLTIDTSQPINQPSNQQTCARASKRNETLATVAMTLEQQVIFWKARR